MSGSRSIPANPYHRVDTLNTARKVEVSLDGVVLAESTRAEAGDETTLSAAVDRPVAGRWPVV